MRWLKGWWAVRQGRRRVRKEMPNLLWRMAYDPEGLAADMKLGETPASGEARP